MDTRAIMEPTVGTHTDTMVGLPSGDLVDTPQQQGMFTTIGGQQPQSRMGSAGYNAWTGNAWGNKVGTSYNSVTGRASAGQRAAVGNVYTGGYAYGQRGATYNPTTGVSARGGSATVGNAYSGQQESAKWGTGDRPRRSNCGGCKVGNNYYADKDGNVYKNTGSGWELHPAADGACTGPQNK